CVARRSEARRQKALHLLVGLSARGQQRNLQGGARRARRKRQAHQSRQRRGALSQRGTVLRLAWGLKRASVEIQNLQQTSGSSVPRSLRFFPLLARTVSLLENNAFI